ncbi:recombinase family protein [Enterococcus sp. AD013-P3]|uniref:recombinase family protein n=1 Tax=Enterococcus sp. AD013-P3 TaxID=3411036 RepID=UPI003B92C4EC
MKEKEKILLGYARVSKSDETQDDSLNSQVKLLRENGCIEVYSEKGSGGNDGRKEFHNLIERAKELSTRYDVSIVCYRLDRLGRNPRLILNTLEDLGNLGINIISISEGLDSNFETGKMMIQMLSIVSSWELTSIRARVQTGIDNARKRGVQLGRPQKYDKSTKSKIIKMYQLNQLTVEEIANRCGVSVSFIYKLLKNSDVSRRR